MLFSTMFNRDSFTFRQRFHLRRNGIKLTRFKSRTVPTLQRRLNLKEKEKYILLIK